MIMVWALKGFLKLINIILAQAKGNADAQYNLGIFYRLGIGVNQDFQESLSWYKLASKQGHIAAQNNLSLYMKKV